MNEAVKVLVIEDDSYARANLAEILQRQGYVVALAGSGAEALRLASDDTMLIIVDRELPDATAESLLPELKRAVPGAEVMVVTAFNEMETTIGAKRGNAADYGVKPIDPMTILERVNQLAEHRRTADKLRQERYFAEKILETADAIVLVLSLSEEIQRFNPFFERISGWKLEQLKGENWFEKFVPAEDQDRVREIFMRTIRDSRTEGIINEIVARDGGRHQVRWSNTTLKDDGGQPAAVLAVGIIITDLVEAQEKAIQSERLAAIGKTMAALAHESRNALQRMRASIDMLGILLADNAAAQKDLLALDRATADMTALHEEVRSFAAPLQLNREAAELPSAWRHAWENLASLRDGRDCALTESLADIYRRVHVDKSRFKQVFRNLIENALAACSDPVRIHISCEASGDDAIRITFRDNGPGLTAEQRAKIFSPFFTTKTSGTGLGMSIVQRIVEAHGGKIEVAADGGDGQHASLPGAAFAITMPIHKTAAITAVQGRTRDTPGRRLPNGDANS